MMNGADQEIDSLSHNIITDQTLMHHDALFKLIIIGDSGVGKSCLLTRLTQNDFKEDHEVTVGVEFGAFVIMVEDKVFKLQIWDTAGQESFKSIIKIFYRGAHCVFLSYDITREDTFQHVTDWMKEARFQASQQVLIFLIGTKKDKEADRKVPYETAKKFAEANGLAGFLETSAKTSENVEDAFVRAAKTLFNRFKDNIDELVREESSNTYRLRRIIYR